MNKNFETLRREDIERIKQNPKSDGFECEKGTRPECSCCEARHTDQCVDGYVLGSNDILFLEEENK